VNAIYLCDDDGENSEEKMKNKAMMSGPAYMTETCMGAVVELGSAALE